MLKLLLFNVGLIFVLTNNVCSYNILVLESLPSPSHHIWIKALTTELASKGHNITSLSSDVDSTNIENLHYLYMNGVYESIHNASSEESDFFEMGKITPWLLVPTMQEYFLPICKVYIESQGYKKLLDYPNNFKFDLVFYDFVGHPCLLPFMHKFNSPPLIALTAFNPLAQTATFVGSNIFPNIPYYFDNRPKQDTFLWRVNNYLLYMADYAFARYYEPVFHKILNPHFPGLPKISELKKRTNLVFINYQPLFEMAEPRLPNVILCGGMQISKPKPLPDNFLKGLDTTKKLVYFALGTNVRSDSLGNERLTQILEAFRSLPEYSFLWKFESDTLPVAVPENVHIKAWMPQNDIFAQVNVSLFITHSGLLSTQEAIWYGVPMLGVPIFVDQFVNIQKSVKIGIAHEYSLHKLDSKTFAEAIKKAVESEDLLENSKAFSKTVRDEPESSLDRAVWWTEWLIRNPNSAKYLSNPDVDLNIIQRQSIDVVAFLTVICIMIISILFKLLKCIFKKSVSKSKVKTN